MARSKKTKTWHAADGTFYGRDPNGNWIRLGWQTGMSDEHMLEYVEQLLNPQVVVGGDA